MRNFNAGGFASWGGFVKNSFGSAAYPSGSDCPKGKNFAVGGHAGAGLNLFFTPNATKLSQLEGPFRVYSLNIGWGVRVLSLQLAVGSDGTWVFTYGGPLGLPFPTGFGYGASYSVYNTNTWVTK